MPIWSEKAENYKHKNLLSDTKRGKEILMFGDIEIENNKFYRLKTPIL